MSTDILLRLTAHQLLLCAAALDALVVNPNVYPPGTIAHRAQKAREVLKLSPVGRELLEASS